MKKNNFSIVLTTVDSKEIAHKLAQKLVKSKLAACVQLSSITSIYYWDKKLNNENEIMLRIKICNTNYTKVQNFIKKNHPYELPQIIQTPILNGYPPYLEWIAENSTKEPN